MLDWWCMCGLPNNQHQTCLEIANEIVITYTYQVGKSRNWYILVRYLGENFNVSSSVIWSAVVENIYQVFYKRAKKIAYCNFTLLQYNPFNDLYVYNSPTKFWNIETKRYYIKYFLPAKFIMGRFACWKEKVTYSDKKDNIIW